MFSPFRTAVVTAVLAGVLTPAAEARIRPARIAPAVVVEAAYQAAAADTQTAASSGGEFTIPASVRHELAAVETAGNMPNPNADLQMWGASGAATGIDAKRAAQIDRFARRIINRTSSIARSLTRSAMRFIGTPYVFGGTSPLGFDCSGYTQHVFAMLGIAIPRTADAQYYAGRPITGGMRTGDLVFFQTYAPGPSHVGIYMGHDRFINSSGHGVMISSLHERYWASRYIGAKRVSALH